MISQSISRRVLNGSVLIKIYPSNIFPTIQKIREIPGKKCDKFTNQVQRSTILCFTTVCDLYVYVSYQSTYSDVWEIVKQVLYCVGGSLREAYLVILSRRRNWEYWRVVLTDYLTSFLPIILHQYIHWAIHSNI